MHLAPDSRIWVKYDQYARFGLYIQLENLPLTSICNYFRGVHRAHMLHGQLVGLGGPLRPNIDVEAVESGP